MTTHSSILAGEIPWAEEPGGRWSVSSQYQMRLRTHRKSKQPTFCNPHFAPRVEEINREVIPHLSVSATGKERQ